MKRLKAIGERKLKRIKTPEDGYRELAYVLVRDTLIDFRREKDKYKREAILHFMESAYFEVLCWACEIDPEFLRIQVKRLEKTG